MKKLGPGAGLPSLAGAAFLRRHGLGRVAHAIAAYGGETRVVGGAVRDALLGRNMGDVDVATTLVPDAVVAAANAAGIKSVPTGIEHGTVTLVTDGEAIEVTSLRRDVETDGRRAVVAFTTDWAVDAQRRDFTMNAIYCSLDGTLHDPVAGYADLQARAVRFIGDADQRISEDHLRILRFFRFHAELGRGAPEAVGLAACRKGVAGLAQLSAERVRAEVLRIMVARHVVPTLEVMAQAGILEGLGLAWVNMTKFTQLVAIDGLVEQPADGLLRFAALVQGDRQTASRLARQFRLSKSERKRLVAFEDADKCLTISLDRTALRVLCHQIGKPGLLDAIKLAWAAGDDENSNSAWLKAWQTAEGINLPAFPIKGRDLLAAGAKPGASLGAVLNELEAFWRENDFEPGSDDLLERYRRDQIGLASSNKR